MGLITLIIMHDASVESIGYFKCPNWYIDYLDTYLTSNESKLLYHILREIKKDGTQQHFSGPVHIAISVLWKGKTIKNKHVYGGTNISRNGIIKALHTLCQYRIISTTGKKTHPKGQQYRLNPCQKIDWKGLQHRKGAYMEKLETILQRTSTTFSTSKNDELVPQPVQALVPQPVQVTSTTAGTDKKEYRKNKKEYNRGVDLSVISSLASAAFKIHQKCFPKTQLSQTQVQCLEEITDLKTWKRVCSIWQGNKRCNPENIGNMVDRYKNELKHISDGNGKDISQPKRKKIQRDIIPIDPQEIQELVEQKRQQFQAQNITI